MLSHRMQHKPVINGVDQKSLVCLDQSPVHTTNTCCEPIPMSVCRQWLVCSSAIFLVDVIGWPKLHHTLRAMPSTPAGMTLR
jgi:hypothetical protein